MDKRQRGPGAPPTQAAFARKVARVVRAIPRGTTLSYGEVALRAGKPRGARAVVWALKQLDDVPWWRVVRHDGTLAPQVAFEQSQLLRAEGFSPRKPAAQRRGAAVLEAARRRGVSVLQAAKRRGVSVFEVD